MSTLHLLLVAPDFERRRALEDQLRLSGNVAAPAMDPADAAQALAVPGLDWLVLDLALPVLDLPGLQRAINPAGPNQPESLAAAERRHIALTLRYTGGNRRQAAQLLGIARSTLLAKLRRYGLEDIGSQS
jgi:DNA-binding NtrC family response regulator